MKRNKSMRLDDLYLVDIIEACEVIGRITVSIDCSQFLEDENRRFALRMNFLIIGEAISKLTEDSKQALSEQPIVKIKGLRNRLAHGYFTINDELLFEIARESIAPLLKAAESLLENKFPEVFDLLQTRRREL